MARNVRQVSRFMDEIINDAETDDIRNGFLLSQLNSVNGRSEPRGRLYLQTEMLSDSLPDHLPNKRNLVITV